jgi:hypothetical protein
LVRRANPRRRGQNAIALDAIVSRDPDLLQLREVRGIRILTPGGFLLFLEQ